MRKLTPFTGNQDGEIFLACGLPELSEHYLVSNFGRVVSLKGKAKVLQPGNNGRGYSGLTIRPNRGRKLRYYLVHALVAATFLGQCPAGFETNHKNLIKCDNRAENLEYVTHAENCRHYHANKSAANS